MNYMQWCQPVVRLPLTPAVGCLSYRTALNAGKRKQRSWLCGDSWDCITASGNQARRQKKWRLLARQLGLLARVNFHCLCMRVYLSDCIHPDNEDGPQNFTMSGRHACSSQQRSSNQLATVIQHTTERHINSATYSVSYSDGPILRVQATRQQTSDSTMWSHMQQSTAQKHTWGSRLSHRMTTTLTCPVSSLVHIGMVPIGTQDSRAHSDGVMSRRRAAEASLPCCPPRP
jgi:hypothetical protein